MKLDLFNSDWINMVFEGKNKKYGAYELRKENSKTSLKSLIIGGLVFSGLMALPLINWGGLIPKNEDKVTMAKMENLPPPPPPDKPLVPPPPPPPPAPKIDEVKFVPPKIVKKEEVTEEIKTMEDLKDKNVSNKDVKGEEGGKIDPIEESGTGPQKEVERVVEEDNKVYNAVEVKPEFPGGMGKFYAFVGKNYQTPDEEGLNGNVMVTFVVEKDGSLTDIKVLRDLGYGTGKEAIRVLKACPKWKPGVQNGREVRVQYSLPIKIQSAE